MRRAIGFAGAIVAVWLWAAAAAGSDAAARGEGGPLGAREVAAVLDMQALRQAMEIAFLDTASLHTLEDLNDIIDGMPNYAFDDIMQGGGAQVIDLATGRFRAQRLDVRQPARRWQGPYVTYQNGHFSIDGAGYDPGTPTDPWGNPYYLYTPVGLVRPTLGTVTLEGYGDAFDRYAIVCVAGDGVVSEDDLIEYFGGGVFHPPTATVISSVRPAVASPGQAVTVRGYNFGAQTGSARIELGGRAIPASAVASWTDRQAAFTLPGNATTGDVVIVTASGSRSNAFRVQIPMRAKRWAMYR
jgi:type II secretory pathway pseudopilin PulG